MYTRDPNLVSDQQPPVAGPDGKSTLPDAAGATVREIQDGEESGAGTEHRAITLKVMIADVAQEVGLQPRVVRQVVEAYLKRFVGAMEDHTRIRTPLGVFKIRHRDVRRIVTFAAKRPAAPATDGE